MNNGRQRTESCDTMGFVGKVRRASRSMLDHAERPSRWPRRALAKPFQDPRPVFGARFLQLGQKHLAVLIGAFHRTSSHLGRDQFDYFSFSFAYLRVTICSLLLACLFSPAGGNSWNLIVNVKHPQGKMFTSGVAKCSSFQIASTRNSFEVRLICN